ncbi:MAG TPA: LLM class flavin-dependent oxidoreductase [Thermomicrobiaceae bacterium]|nr:LLM class flavin-dependent oxidoreductase [Thermomicrobiaceae bacterium]
MKVGLFARTGDRTLDGQPVGFDDIKALAVAAEATGFDSFWLPDHFVYRPHEPEQLGCWEVFTFLSALAGATSRIALGPFVAATSFRNPALLARMAASLDEISGGRFILGLGAGNWEPEHTMYGYPFDHRAGRFAEAVQVIAPLLREGTADFHGRYVQATDAVLQPRGPSPAGPPIWAGARGERMLRIIARHADAFIAIWPITPAQVTEQWARMRSACAEVGRDPATLELVVGTFVHPPEHGRPVHDGGEIGGSDEEIAATLRAFAQSGVDHLVIDVRPDTSVPAIAACGRILSLLKQGAGRDERPGQ